MTNSGPKLLETTKIWSRAPHNAFTDLIYYQNRFWCVFRESDEHAEGEDGAICLISSTDGTEWAVSAEIALEGYDLRDPKLCEMPDGRLMLLIGGSTPHNGGVQHHAFVCFSKDGHKWSALVACMSPGHWLWRVTWHKGRGYGAAYSYTDPADRSLPWHLNLFTTDDGIHYHLVTPLAVDGHPNETTLRFNAAGEMMALVRREEVDNDQAFFAMSQKPYQQWEWRDTGLHLGGPNFVLDRHGRAWVGARVFRQEEETSALLSLISGRCTSLITLESGGDTGYPGMVIHDLTLWMSYYSSHEGKSNIYLAKIQLPKKG